MKPKTVGRPSNPAGPTRSVRIANDVAKMACRIADWRGIALSDYLSEKLRDGVRLDFQAIMHDYDEIEDISDLP